MKHLAPYRGTLFRLALTNALLGGLIAMAFVTVQNMRRQQAVAGAFDVEVSRHALGSAVANDDRGGPTEADQRFIRAAAELLWEEMRVAEIGARRAIRAEVRGFAQELASQRQSARNEIENLATRKGILLPTADTPSEAADRVAASRGERFDASFVAWAKVNHAAALKLFEQAIDECSDPELRDFAMRLLPRLKAHFEQARRLDRTTY